MSFESLTLGEILADQALVEILEALLKARRKLQEAERRRAETESDIQVAQAALAEREQQLVTVKANGLGGVYEE